MISIICFSLELILVRVEKSPKQQIRPLQGSITPSIPRIMSCFHILLRSIQPGCDVLETEEPSYILTFLYQWEDQLAEG